MATVMVVDDSKTVRSYHGSILRDLGVNVLEAENGMEALEKTLDNEVNLYLVDVNMPVMDGYEATREIRKLSLDVPIIAVTAFAYASD